MPEVKILTKLPDPKESDRDGLPVLREKLLNNPGAEHLIIARVTCGKIETNYADGGATQTPSALIVHIEAVPPRLREDEIRAVLDAIYRSRTRKQATLPGLGDDPDEVTAL